MAVEVNTPVVALEPPPAAVADEVKIPFGTNIAFSGLAGAVATTCIYAIDFTKTQLQNQKGLGAAREFSGPLDVVVKTIRRQGILGLYKGYPPNVVLVMPEKAIKLTMNDTFRGMVMRSREDGKVPLHMGALAGGAAGACQVAATNPMELLKIQGAVQEARLKSGELSARLSAVGMANKLGVVGCYTGVLSTLLRDVTFSMIYFPLYALATEKLEDRARVAGETDMHEGALVRALQAGTIAGTFAAGLTTPLDVIKTRVHGSVRPERIGLGSLLRTEGALVADTFRTIRAAEGLGSFFRGVVPRCIIIAPLFGITMMTLEQFKSLYRDHFE